MAIPVKNTPLIKNLLLIRVGGVFLYGGYSYPTQISKKIRLRRAKNRVFGVFEAKNFPPAAGIQQTWFPKSFYERRNALLLFVKRSSIRADAVPGVFTSVGTRFYYSQNDLDSGSGADAGPGVSTSVGTRFYYSQIDLTATQTQFLAFSGV